MCILIEEGREETEIGWNKAGEEVYNDPFCQDSEMDSCKGLLLSLLVEK